MDGNEAIRSSSPPHRQRWNKGKLIGAKPPLRASHGAMLSEVKRLDSLNCACTLHRPEKGTHSRRFAGHTAAMFARHGNYQRGLLDSAAK